METLKLAEMELTVQTEVVETVKANWGCPVCGMDEWCGSDGCPMDPQ